MASKRLSDGSSLANSFKMGRGATSVAKPNAPTIGVATANGSTAATVTFTAPTFNGGRTITTYTATSSPGSITGTLSQAGSGTINISGLTSGVTYTFTITATNELGTSLPSSASNSIQLVTPSQQAYTTPGTYTWTAPAGVTSVPIVNKIPCSLSTISGESISSIFNRMSSSDVRGNLENRWFTSNDLDFFALLFRITIKRIKLIFTHDN